MRALQRLALVVLTTMAFAGVVAMAEETAKPAVPVVEEVKIVVDNKAKNDGEIHFAFTPEGGASQDVRVTIAKGMGKQDICRDIAKELTVAVGPAYKVEHYDDDKVKVARKKDAKFSLTVASQTVSGVSVTLK